MVSYYCCTAEVVLGVCRFNIWREVGLRGKTLSVCCALFSFWVLLYR